MNPLSRRDALKYLCAAALLTTQSCAQTGKTRDSAGATTDLQSAERWMDSWMRGPKAPVGTLHVSRFADPIYFLTKEIGWAPNLGQSGYEPVTVPVGFVTDFASIPRIFWSLLRPDGTYTYPAIVHDYLYWMQPVPRDVADQILKFGMEDFKIDSVTIEAVYSGVRLGGRTAWENNAQLKAAGEKRVLRRFPDDPRIRWDEWKRRPDVF